VVRFSRSAERDEAGRAVRGAAESADRMLEEKAPTEKTPVVKASSRACGRAEEFEVLMCSRVSVR
jgi:hypothetical protein